MRCSVGQAFGSFQNFARAVVGCRISRFSSSVMVMMRSARISSISVPSNKSPGLSGAICG